METSDIEYAKLTNEVLKFVVSERSKNNTLSIVDLIVSYCFKRDIEPELVGDAISQDFYFKRLIENDMKTRPLQEW